MRPSLLPGLIAAARRNLDRGAASVRLFELGRRYLGDAEHPTLTFLLAGDKQRARLAERQGARLRRVRRQGRSAGAARSRRSAGRQPAGHRRRRTDTGIPGRSARLGLGPKTIVASFGELHPGLQKTLDAPAGAVAGEIYLDAIPAPRSSATRARRLCAAALAADHPRLRLHRAGRAAPPTRWFARSAARQGRDHRRAAVRPLRKRRRPVARGRSHAAAGRQELHRRTDRRDLAPHRRCRREARRAPEELGQRVDRGVNAALDLVAFEARRNRFADLERHRAGAMDEAPAPQPPAVDCDRNDRQTERPVEAGEARLERRRFRRRGRAFLQDR